MSYNQEENVRTFLKSHPQFLENFILEEVDVDLLERWIILKARNAEKPNTFSERFPPRGRLDAVAEVGQAVDEISLPEYSIEIEALKEISKCIASAVNADGHHLHPIGDPNGQRCKVTEPEIERLVKTAAETGKIARVIGSRHGDSWHSLIQPVTGSDGAIAGVLHFWRFQHKSPFEQGDEDLVTGYFAWGSGTLLNARMHASATTQRRLQEFLLQVVRSIFQDMANMDAVVGKIIDFAQHLVQADRASLFLIDSEKNELYARLFDFGSSATDADVPTKAHFRDLRFPADAGIAGHVAKTGQLLNIADAYADPRFNRTVDQMTGYRTRSILCMPIFQESQVVIGVVQMVNKKSGSFTEDDEKAFEMFAVYCGLALHHAKLFETINASEQKYKVALEVLSYHSTCTDAEMEQVTFAPEKLAGLDGFDLDFLAVDDMEKARQTIYMFNDLFGFGEFDLKSIARFTLTVRKNYRRVPYHNWTHGFGVANAMYAIIKRSAGIFNYVERLALFIGALCHDLDHRGKNNKFMIESASPLANMYTTSTMEHHHFNQTVAILQQDGHNFLQKLDKNEYRQVLHIVKHCILATDLENFFSNEAELKRIISEGKFSLDDAEHRSLVRAMAMTGSDLSASAKPWNVQIETVRVIFKEFYEQGDEERAAGRAPAPMMDRNQPDKQAPSQVEFLSQICIPCYSLLAKVVPGATPLLSRCRDNLKRWRDLCRNGGSVDTPPPPLPVNTPLTKQGRTNRTYGNE